MKKRIITLIIILLLLIPWLVGPFVNDYIAKGIVRSIVDIPTPKNTDIVETSYKSGDLTSATEGMEYFGAALIKTKLDLATLKRYYKQYSTDHLEYIVEAQPESKITVIENDPPRFLSMLNTGTHDYYIVYAWGSSNNVLSVFDLRGY
ncbi:MAG: hypothetical protein J6H21_04105 [Firmicutes bacterium]|nr:hypothetical protein [Bacillota bacterium]